MSQPNIDALINALNLAPEESDIQRQIRLAREELARLDEIDRLRSTPVVPVTPDDDADDWTQQEPLKPLQAGDWISFFGSVVLHTGESLLDSFSSVVTRYGQDLELSEALLQNNCSFWELIDRSDEQQRRFRRETPLAVRGKWDPRKPRFERGSIEESQRRDIARADAFKISDPDEQRRALRAVDDLYGVAPTSQTLAAYRGGLR
jgi:hypothetical protein